MDVGLPAQNQHYLIVMKRSLNNYFEVDCWDLAHFLCHMFSEGCYHFIILEISKRAYFAVLSQPLI